MRRYFFILIVFISIDCFAQTNILFVGNSLTYTNDLPSLLKNIARADGIQINTEMIAFPNYALEDHWNEGNVSSALRQSKFDYVIFQQGPSGLAASRQNLIEYALKFSALCKVNNAHMCMYGVWPSRDRAFDFQNVINSYAAAADTSEAILLPAGAVWKNILEQHKNIPLYSADGFHPSLHGSVLSAMVIYATLFNKANFDFLSPKNLPSPSVSTAELKLMKGVALSLKD